MYRAIVASRIRQAWRHLDAHDHAPVVAQFAEPFEHRFAGDHALGGTRRTKASQDVWFQRVFRLFPDIRFTVRDVLVAGWPWRTRAVVLIDVLVPSGGYTNEVAQTIELRWGRITRVNVLEDTQRLAAVLAEMAAAGVEEAAAAPISDEPQNAAWEATTS